MNYHDKHMRCSFVPAKDGEGKGALLGVQCAKPLAGPQMKVTSKGASEDKGANRLGRIKSGTPLASISILSSNSFCRAGPL